MDKDDITKPISETVRALAGTPMLLVLVVINVLVLGMVTYLIKGRAEGLAMERTELLKLLDNCLEENQKHGGAMTQQNFKLKFDRVR